MPWTPKQMRAIQARAHGWDGPGAFGGVGVAKAKDMASEGTKPQSVRSRLSDAVSKMRAARM